MITKYLPKFKQIEVNNLTGLRTGFMLSQFKASDDITKKTVNDEIDFIENGLMVGLGEDLTIENYSADSHSQLFVHYSEELNTFIDELQYYALPVDEVKGAYPRAVAMFIGDTITTDNVDLGDEKYDDLDADTLYYFAIVNGVATLQDDGTDLLTEKDEDTVFVGKLSSLPNGKDAIELVYVQDLGVKGAKGDTGASG